MIGKCLLMEIQGQQVNMQSNGHGRSLQLREGEVYNAKIESRVSDREAVISIRGQEVKAKFEGSVPKGDRVTVQVEGRTDEGVRVREITADANGRDQSRPSGRQGDSVDRVLRNFGERDASPELRQAAQRLLNQGIPLTRETVQDLSRYIERGGGTISERLETISMMANKRLAPTESQIRAVHEALHGREFTNAMRELIQSHTPTVNNSVDLFDNSRQLVQFPVATGNDNQNSIQILLTQWAQQVQSEPNLMKAIDELKNHLTQQTVTDDVRNVINQGINEATNRLEAGRELKARQQIVDTLQMAQNIVANGVNTSNNADLRPQIESYVKNEIFQSYQGSSKQMLITQVTERLALATDEFKGFQRDVSKQLGRVEMIIQQFQTRSTEQARPMLENIIRQLDQAILKNDWLLFADMKTEKRVLEISSKLANAKSLLARGEHMEARQVVREVQQQIDRLQFQPSNQRVQHVVSQEQLSREPRTPAHQLSSLLDQTSRSLLQQDGSPRQLFENIRTIGLNRESELSQMLASGKDSPAESQQKNMKSILYQMLRSEEEGSRAHQQAQQALQNLSGQQLMSRTDHQQNMQMLMIQLPLLLKGQAENLQVFINSKNDGEKIDWENCQLYFLIDTKKMGEVGISLTVSNRALSVTLKNDASQFKQKVEPIAAKYVDRLKEIGFNINGLKFTKMTVEEEKKANKEEETPQRATMTKEGFDYKI